MQATGLKNVCKYLILLLFISCSYNTPVKTKFYSLESSYQRASVYFWRAEYKDAVCYQTAINIICFKKIEQIKAEDEEEVYDDQDLSQPPGE